MVAAAANYTSVLLLLYHHLCPMSAVLQLAVLVSVMPGRCPFQCQSVKDSCSCNQRSGFHNCRWCCCFVDNQCQRLAGYNHCLGYTLQCFGYSLLLLSHLGCKIQHPG